MPAQGVLAVAFSNRLKLFTYINELKQCVETMDCQEWDLAEWQYLQSAVSRLMPFGSSGRWSQLHRFRICGSPRQLTDSGNSDSFEQPPRFRLSRPTRLPISSGTSQSPPHPFRFRFTSAVTAPMPGGRPVMAVQRLRLRAVRPVSRARGCREGLQGVAPAQAQALKPSKGADLTGEAGEKGAVSVQNQGL